MSGDTPLGHIHLKDPTDDTNLKASPYGPEPYLFGGEHLLTTTLTLYINNNNNADGHPSTTIFLTKDQTIELTRHLLATVQDIT